MEEIMKEVVLINGVISCYLVDREGEIIGHVGSDKLDKSMASAIVAAITKELSTQMSIADNFAVTVMAERKYLFVVAKKNFILAVFTDSDIDTGKIRFELRRCVKAISEAL
jgi:predicted regulator of Ras-like GTPase activity (Roadblock/LC7/MglB family)